MLRGYTHTGHSPIRQQFARCVAVMSARVFISVIVGFWLNGCRDVTINRPPAAWTALHVNPAWSDLINALDYHITDCPERVIRAYQQFAFVRVMSADMTPDDCYNWCQCYGFNDCGVVVARFAVDHIIPLARTANQCDNEFLNAVEQLNLMRI